MSLGGFLDESLPGLEDDVRSVLDDGGDGVADALDGAGGPASALPALDVTVPDFGFDVGDGFGDTLEDLLGASGLPGFDGGTGIQNLNDIAALAEGLPGGLGEPDATGEVATGSAAISRKQALVGATLAAAPRILEAFGDNAWLLSIGGTGGNYLYSVDGRYLDPQSGFSAVRVTPADGSKVTFAVDGLEVGSRADEVAAGTLGRLQIDSDAFRQMVADAVAVVAQTGRPVEFVGPSLGGAVAQAAAYETAEALTAAERTAGADLFQTGAVQRVTVDALGGRDATEAVNGGSLDPQALSLIQGLNLRTEGDVVSRIGSHIGSTLTFPGRDAAGNLVALDAAEAHVNVTSLLQTLSSDALFAQGTPGAPAEISGFAPASNAASDAAIAAWRASGGQEEGLTSLQIPGYSIFDPTRTTWVLDADLNGKHDAAVALREPASQAVADLVLVG